MTKAACITTPELESLRHLCTVATQNASAVMSRWTGSQIHLELEEVHESPLDEICGELKIGDELLTMVVVEAAGDMGAELVLMFKEASSRHLAECLLGRLSDGDPAWDDLERSALTETGNILACAYLNAVAHLIDKDLIPSPPIFLRDYGASVLQQAIMSQAVEWNKVLVCRTLFMQEGKQLDWQVLFVPNEEMRKCIEHAFNGYEQGPNLSNQVNTRE
jgi:chemotaxis protein CheC